MRVLGLDPSLTSFGVSMLKVMDDPLAGLTGGWAAATETWGPRRRGAERLAWFYSKLEKTVLKFRPNMIALEGYAYAKGNQAHQIGELGGVLRFLLHRMGATPTIIAPAKLKKFVTGKGNSGKDIMMLEAYKRFGIDTPTTDECDATCLALMVAVGRYGLEVDLPKVNLTALEGIEYPW